jgi:RND family efflux transporter MFP subunit
MSGFDLALALCICSNTQNLKQKKVFMNRALRHCLKLGLIFYLGAAASVWAQGPEKTPARQFAAQAAFRQAEITGFTRARAFLQVVSEVSGRCLKVTADVGEAIGPSGVFVRLDSTFVDLELKRNLVEQALAVTKLKYTEKEFNRHRKLVRSKSEPQSKLDALETERDQAELQLQALKTAAEVIRERQSRHKVKAPPGWLVVSRQVEPGSWVNAGAPLATLGDYSTLVVPMALAPEEHAWLLSHRHKLSVTLSPQGKQVAARIYRVSPAFDPATRKINVELALDGNIKSRRGGLMAALRMTLPDPSGAVLVPASALQRRYQEYWLTRPDGSQVKVLLLGPGPDGGQRVSSPGVKPGDRFLAQPLAESK